MDLIDQYESGEEEPATPPTPPQSSGRQAAIPGPEWTVDLVANTDVGTLYRALQAAGADFSKLWRHWAASYLRKRARLKLIRNI